MARTVLTALFTFMAAVSMAGPTRMPTTRGLFPQDPSTDPFYQPPRGFENKAPGTVLKTRRVIPALFGLIPNPVEAHQLLYRTTAVNGSAIATATTIFKTLGAPPTDRFLSFQTAYDSASTICNPSYVYQFGAPQDSFVASLEMLLIQVYLLLGYTVASPDYEGPDAAFAAGRLEGMGVLDGMRAVKNYGKNVGFTTPDPAIVGLGYSGGAIATGWAASLQSQYASELNVKGWAMGGPPANLSGTFMQIDGTVFSGFVPIALAGLNKPSAYGAELKPVFDQIATEAGREALEFVNHNCVIADLINFAGESLLTTEYQSLGPNLLANEELDRVLSHNLMGSNSSETPKVPTFVYHATEDQVIPYENTEALVDTWCGDGVNLNFTTFAAGGHLTTEVIALPDVVGFIANAFEGTKATGCSRTTNLADALNPIALGVGLEPILIQLVNALLVLGDGDSNVMNDIGMLRKTMKL